MQTAFIENFNGRLRDELLNELLFMSVALGRWRTDYYDRRPHSQFGWKTPSSPSPGPLAGVTSRLGKTWGKVTSKNRPNSTLVERPKVGRKHVRYFSWLGRNARLMNIFVSATERIERKKKPASDQEEPSSPFSL
jgi:hypothetical protein